jgi:hypothetical protein
MNTKAGSTLLKMARLKGKLMTDKRSDNINEIKKSIQNLYKFMFKIQYSDPEAYKKAKSQVQQLKKQLNEKEIK